MIKVGYLQVATEDIGTEMFCFHIQIYMLEVAYVCWLVWLVKVSGYKCTHMCDVVGGDDCGENDEISYCTLWRSFTH